MPAHHALVLTISTRGVRPPFPASETNRVLSRVMKEERLRSAVLDIVFVGGAEMRMLNRSYLGHNADTDIITFQYSTKPPLEGELFINLEQARKNAKAFGETVSSEVRRLLIHGVLHLTGWDDRTTALRAAMRNRENELLTILGKRK